MDMSEVYAEIERIFRTYERDLNSSKGVNPPIKWKAEGAQAALNTLKESLEKKEAEHLSKMAEGLSQQDKEALVDMIKSCPWCHCNPCCGQWYDGALDQMQLCPKR